MISKLIIGLSVVITTAICICALNISKLAIVCEQTDWKMEAFVLIIVCFTVLVTDAFSYLGS